MKNRTTIIDQAVARELLRFDRKAGVFTWKRRARRWFTSDQSHASWNAKFAGQRAFTGLSSKGYPTSRVLWETWMAHRMAWLYVFGEIVTWPHELDHINQDKTDYRISNLRKVERAVNMRNRTYRPNVGVRMTPIGRFEARITIDGVPIALGTFASKAEAISARKAAERTAHGYGA